MSLISSNATKSTRAGAIRFVLVALALVLGVTAQLLVGGGNLRWAITPYLVAVLAMALAVAGRPISSFVIGPTESRRSAAAVAAQQAGPDRNLRLERLLGLSALALSLLMLLAALLGFAAGPPNTLAWYSYGASVLLLLLALPSVEGGGADLSSV